MTNSNTVSLPFSEKNSDPFLRKCNSTFMAFFNKTRPYDFSTRTYLSIIFTANQLHNSPENISRMLVESGLRAGLTAFPDKFIDYIKDRSNKNNHPIRCLTPAQKALINHWQTPKIQVHYISQKHNSKPSPIPKRRSMHHQITGPKIR